MTHHTHHATLSPVTLKQVTGLVDAASGADTAAIEALESVVTNLRASQAARLALATRVPTELLRQVLPARCAGHRSGYPQ